MTTQFPCYNCNKQIDVSHQHPLGFRDSCSHCGRDAHVCRNCDLYDENAHHECRESSAEWVRDKERGNRCEYFKSSTKGSLKAGHTKTDTLAALDSLFKK
jgi:hypothetical protein